MDVWTWVSTTTSFQSVLSTLGLGVLAFLFARDLILTKGAHLRRVQDLIEFHEKVLQEKDARIVDYQETIKSLTEAVKVQTDRADKATEALSQATDAIRENTHVLDALDSALPRGDRA